MPALVVDASIALAWALPDESSAYAEAALSVVERDGLRVPELWPREIANGLAVAYLRKRITAAEEAAFLTALSHLTIAIEAASPLAVIREGTAAAARFGLTAYDAAYVDLALREQLALATLDRSMLKAAEQSGVAIFPPISDQRSRGRSRGAQRRPANARPLLRVAKGSCERIAAQQQEVADLKSAPCPLTPSP
jgi:predicted nucleic acid-binding protein